MEKNKQQHLNMKEKVLLQIDVDGLAMHSKRYFTLKAAFFIIVAFFALVIAVLISNFILFTIRISGYDSLLGFGPRGLLLFVQLFPWILLSIDIILVLILQTLIRQFHFGYSKPSLYMFLVLVFLTVSTAG